MAKKDPYIVEAKPNSQFGLTVGQLRNWLKQFPADTSISIRRGDDEDSTMLEYADSATYEYPGYVSINGSGT